MYECPFVHVTTVSAQVAPAQNVNAIAAKPEDHLPAIDFVFIG
jgi:hypothetical protein